MDPGRLHRAVGGSWLEASPLRQRPDAGLRFGGARRSAEDRAEGSIEERRVVGEGIGGGDPGRDPGSGIVDESGIGKRQRLLWHDAPLALVTLLHASAVEGGEERIAVGIGVLKLEAPPRRRRLFGRRH